MFYYIIFGEKMKITDEQLQQLKQLELEIFKSFISV